MADLYCPLTEAFENEKLDEVRELYGDKMTAHFFLLFMAGASVAINYILDADDEEERAQHVHEVVEELAAWELHLRLRAIVRAQAANAEHLHDN
jgi:hypothetical protein